MPCRVAEPEPVGARADLKFDLEPEQFFGNDFKMFIFLVNYTYFCIINSTFWPYLQSSKKLNKFFWVGKSFLKVFLRLFFFVFWTKCRVIEAFLLKFTFHNSFVSKCVFLDLEPARANLLWVEPEPKKNILSRSQGKMNRLRNTDTVYKFHCEYASSCHGGGIFGENATYSSNMALRCIG